MALSLSLCVSLVASLFILLTSIEYIAGASIETQNGTIFLRVNNESDVVVKFFDSANPSSVVRTIDVAGLDRRVSSLEAQLSSLHSALHSQDSTLSAFTLAANATFDTLFASIDSLHTNAIQVQSSSAIISQSLSASIASLVSYTGLANASLAEHSSLLASSSNALVSADLRFDLLSTSIVSSFSMVNSHVNAAWNNTSFTSSLLQSHIDVLAQRTDAIETQADVTLPTMINTTISSTRTQLTQDLADNLQASFITLSSSVNSTILSLMDTIPASATRVTTNVSIPCISSYTGGIRFNVETSKLETCDGSRWFGLSFEPLGSVRNPATSCRTIYNTGANAQSGLYSFYISSNRSEVAPIYCDMAAIPPVSLGGDGSSPALASTSCSLLASQFSIPTSVRYLVINATNAESLTYVVRALCVVDPLTHIGSLESYDGTEPSLSASSCSTLKFWFHDHSDVYFINGLQILCNMTSGNGTAMGGDGSTAVTAAVNCESIRQHNLATGRTPVSGVYYIGAYLSGGPYQVYCELSATFSRNDGGSGTTPLTASTSCAVIQAHFSTVSGPYYLVNSPNADDTSQAFKALCIMSSTPPTYGGGDGSTSALAAYSCLSAYEYFSVASSGVLWVNPSSPFQAYCDQSDGGGWMQFLHLITSTYDTNTGAFGMITMATPPANAKLADDQINYPSGVTKVFKYVSADTSNIAYVRTNNAYVDTSVGTGLFTNFYACEGASYFICSTVGWRGPSSYGYLDTLGDSSFWGIFQVGNDNNRIFMDYSDIVSCYATAGLICSGNCRCYNCGMACNNHQPIVPFIAYVRTYP